MGGCKFLPVETGGIQLRTLCVPLESGRALISLTISCTNAENCVYLGLAGFPLRIVQWCKGVPFFSQMLEHFFVSVNSVPRDITPNCPTNQCFTVHRLDLPVCSHVRIVFPHLTESSQCSVCSSACLSFCLCLWGGSSTPCNGQMGPSCPSQIVPYFHSVPLDHKFVQH